MTRRVQILPWECMLPSCTEDRPQVFLWRDRVWCRCQMSAADREALRRDARQDNEDAARHASDATWLLGRTA